MEILLFEDLINKGFSKNAIFKEIAGYEGEFFLEYPYTVKDIKEFCQKSRGYILILLDKNRIIGYLIPLLFRNRDYLQILTIAVGRNYQKRGYGTQLIRKCEEIANSLRLKRVIVRADVSYPILKTCKNLKYLTMGLRDINEFIKEGIFSPDDKVKKAIPGSKLPDLFPRAYIITKNIGKKNSFSFVPMIKHLPQYHKAPTINYINTK